MNAGLIGLIAVVILLGGLFMGVASLFLFPIVGALAFVALLIWLLRRRAANKPPVP